MSYILDALRRADSERSRGAVPGVHAQPLPPGAAQTLDGAPRSVPLAWVAIGGLLVLVGVLAWQLFRTEPPRAVAVAAPLPRAIEPAAPPAPIAEPEPAPAPEAAPPPAPTREAPVSIRKPAKREAASPKPAPTAESPAPKPETPIVKQAELPPQIRSQLPKLDVGGSVYSKNPASRYLILNGQVFRENAEVAKDLTLEQIHLRSAVFRFKDYRYSITY